MQNQYGGRNQPTDKPAGTEGQEKVDTAQMSVIGADIVITGNIEASVDLHIEGKIVGDVRCKTLILGESSSIEGRIHCERVRVSGSVNGSIDARDLAVEATAKVAGEIAYERLRVAKWRHPRGQRQAQARRGKQRGRQAQARRTPSGARRCSRRRRRRRQAGSRLHRIAAMAVGE